jgi:hypothetical protein
MSASTVCQVNSMLAVLQDSAMFHMRMLGLATVVTQS